MKKFQIIFLAISFFLVLLGRTFDAAYISFSSIILLLWTLCFIANSILIIFWLIKSVIGVVKRKNDSLIILGTSILAYVFCLFVFWGPYQSWVNDLFYGKSKIVAYYEGTQNQAELKLRKNNTFQIKWTGWGGGYSAFKGAYSMTNSIIHMEYTGPIPRDFTGKAKVVDHSILLYDAMKRLYTITNAEDSYHEFEITYTN